MDMEIVSKLLKMFLLHHQFVQVNNTVMETETVIQIQYQFLVLKDGSRWMMIVHVGLFLIIGVMVMRMIAQMERMIMEIVYHYHIHLQDGIALMVT